MRKILSIVMTCLMTLVLLIGNNRSSKGDTTNDPKKLPGKKILLLGYSRVVQTIKDGIYVGKSRPDDYGAVGKITIEIKEGKIIKAIYKTFMKNGKIKDAEYGKTNGKIENQEFYKKAQKAVKAMAIYAARLVQTQNVNQVDTISGATISHTQFVEAAQKALDAAKQK